MTASTLPFAARAAGLVGSVIDSSTSLLQKQSHDVVRLAMGSPARVRRALTEAEVASILDYSRNYVRYRLDYMSAEDEE